MFCGKCGTENEEDFQFCKKCGFSIANQTQPVNPSINTNNNRDHENSDYLKQLCNLNPDEEVLGFGRVHSNPEMFFLWGISSMLLMIFCVFLIEEKIISALGALVFLLLGVLVSRILILHLTIIKEQSLIVTNQRILGKAFSMGLDEVGPIFSSYKLVEINYPFEHLFKANDQYKVGFFENKKVITLTTNKMECNQFLCLENHEEMLAVIQKELLRSRNNQNQ